jgi:hypothetical protein
MLGRGGANEIDISTCRLAHRAKKDFRSVYAFCKPFGVLKTMTRTKSKYYKNPKGYVYYNVTVPYEHHLGKLWDDCKRLTYWVYDNDKKIPDLKFIPQVIKSDIDVHTLNAMRFALAFDRRSKVRSEDFYVCFFGKQLAPVKRPTGYVAINTLLAISLPCFDIDKIEDFHSIRWCRIYEDRILYNYVTLQPRQPFNINALPNLMIAADTDDDE